MTTSSVDDLLGADGPVARRLPAYEERAEQRALARAVEQALQTRRHLLAEAGTGVGKSFAYLLPAIAHACAHHGSGPIVISTRTIALQQQLEHKDLPFLQQVLPLEFSSVTAVGRNNYLCLRRLHGAHRERALLFADAGHEEQLAHLMEWSLSTREGTAMELGTQVAKDVWAEVRAEHGNCLHRACPHYDPCHYQRARRRMGGAQVLIVNHSLYMADVALRMAGASYLPAHSVVVFDEAHHLERVARENLGLRLTEATVQWHLRRLHSRRTARSLLAEFGTARARALWDAIDGAGAAWFAELDAMLAAADRAAIPLGDRELDGALAQLLGELGSELTGIAAGIDSVDRKMELTARAQGLLGLQAVVDRLRRDGETGMVRWVEKARQGAVLRAAPLSVREPLAAHVFDESRTAVLVSATLGAGRDRQFRWLRRQLRIENADCLALGSPFDYRRHVRLTVEEALPDPAGEPRAFAAESKTRVRDHLVDNGGRALVLCTSWRTVAEIADFVRPTLLALGIPLLVQGAAPLQQLLAAKREQPTSVLVGTDSLWEGIDVPGDALTLVLITRLPFQPPDHPLTVARMRAIEHSGGNAFADLSLPEAVLRFRQGFGRLVRRATDHGRVVILDPRVRTKRYGREFLDALPDGVSAD